MPEKSVAIIVIYQIILFFAMYANLQYQKKTKITVEKGLFEKILVDLYSVVIKIKYI